MELFKKYLAPFYKTMFMALFLKASASVVELLLPYILQIIIDDVVPTKNVTNVFIWMGIMILCAIVAMLTNRFANMFAAMTSRDFTRDVRHDLFDKTLYLTCEKCDEFTIPSLESRLTSDTYNLQRLIVMGLRIGVKSPMMVVGGIIISFIMEPVLALVLIATIPFLGFLVYLRATRVMPEFRKIHGLNDRMIGVVRENTQGIRVIKALSKTEYEKERFDKANVNLKNQEFSTHLRMATIHPFMMLFLNMGMIGTILLGAYRVNLGLSGAGKIIAFMSYFTQISQSVMTIGRIFTMGSRGLTSANRILEVLNTPSEKDYEVKEYPDGDPEYAIEFKDVTFSYLKVKDNLKNISFRLRKGESLGIIGATGAGKSTILHLLLNFYQLDSGAIYVGGKDIRSMKPQELRQRFGITSQNDFLFADTLKENIVFGRDADDKAIDEAMTNAQAIEFVDRLPDRTDYHITTRGTNVSGGQRQRILLSRAFMNHPEFLLLDDSSSALDYATDAKLRKAIDTNYKDTTKIIVAQRVSSVKNCDQILVLDNGEINGLGTHDDLINVNEVYTSISESQMGGALLD